MSEGTSTLALEVVRGDASPRRIEVHESITLGREPGAGMRVLDAAVSRRHASIAPARSGGWLVIDLESSNGTFVNGKRIRQARIESGDLLQLGDTTLRVLEVAEGQRRTVILRGGGAGPDSGPSSAPPAQLLGTSPCMVNIRSQIAQIAPSDTTVLITGETGTGKELAALLIHQSSPRAAAPFVPINCAAIAPSLVESELFGHERGAFTGATQRKEGRFELARGGTLFLDEIGEMPLEIQAKLLRAIETRTIERVGGGHAVAVDARFIAATNCDLRQQLRSGGFREDLFYRLCVVTVRLPPLREHCEDVPLLAAHFLGEQAAARISKDGMALLAGQPWPGNVRELKNVLQAAALLAGAGPVEGEHLRQVLAATTPADDGASPAAGLSLRDAERSSIQRALEHTGWNKSAAARILGISRPTLHKKIREYELKRS